MKRLPPARSPRHCILPPDLLVRLAKEGTEEQRQAALSTLAVDHSFRLARAEASARTPARHARPAGLTAAAGHPHRMIYDQKHSSEMRLGTLVRAEGAPAASDGAINDAYDNFGATYQYYWDVNQRDSIDGQGMAILGLVHFDTNYDNAFWDGQGHMFFGDGDGQLLTQTTKGLDVIGHELTHGVTQHEANLTYSGQSGALNESISDVFGSLVKQYKLKQDAASADWLIGADIVGPALAPALRSMKDPGHANPHDNQPATMAGYVKSNQDNGGVHTNSGIPNKAFYVVATTIGGNAWEAPGRIWFAALSDPKLSPNATFSDFAKETVAQASALYGATSSQVDGVKAGWEAVQVPV
ncbi:MAG: M4 family metallopeptidase [Acidimicrobiales bacterium]